MPYVDFNNLPEKLDESLLEKIMLYQKDGEVREAVFDLLSEEQVGQIAQFKSKIYEEEKAQRRALMTDEEKRKEKEWWDNYNADLLHAFSGIWENQIP